MNSRPIHVLLIEDNPGDIRLVRELFAQTRDGQFTLAHVGRLDAGIRCLSESLIDVILLDLSLPDSQGIETLIRMHAAAHGIPIVLMTGLEDEELGLHLIQAGAQDYLIKGQASAPLLARALTYAVGRKRLEEELREQTRFLQSVLNSMADGVVMADETGTFRVWNPAAEHILGSGPAKKTAGQWSDEYTIFLPDKVTPCPAQDIPLARAIRGESVTGATLFLKRRSQRDDLWLDVSARPLRDEMGLIKGGVVVFRDISETRRIDDALRDSQERYRLLVTKANDIIYRTDASGRFTFVNPVAMRIMKYTEPELLGRRFIELIHPQHQPAAERFYGRQFVRQQPSTYYEFLALAKDGSEVWIGQNVQVLLEEGIVIGFQAVARDITERKRAEEALQESEERLRSIVQSTGDAIILMDTRGNVAFWNSGAEKIFGYTAREIFGQPVTRIIPERFREAHLQGVARVAAAGRLTMQADMFELVGLRRDGTEFPLEFSLAAWTTRSKLFITGIIRDISERRQAEAALRESEERFRRIMENSPALIFIKDVEGRYLQTNRQFETIFRLTPSEIVGKTDLDVFPPEQAAAFRANDCRVLEAGTPMEFEEVAIHDDGPHTSLVVKFPLLDAQGRCYALCGIATDITDRKRAEEERQKLAKDRLLLLESTGEGIYGLDRQGRCTFINSAASRMLGYSPEELLGQDMHERIHHFLRDGAAYLRPRCHIHETLVDGKGRKIDDEVYWRKDGTSFPVEYSSFPVIEQDLVTGAVVVFLDITDRKRAEQQLTASHDQLRKLTARLESVREEERILIAREIHDELGQALTGVKLELSLLRDQLPDVSPTVHTRLESSSGLVDATIQSVRRIATDLRPIVLDQLGLIPAIEWQTQEFQSRTGIQCRLDIYLRSAPLSQTASTAMFRIFQEVLTNVVRHAKASVVQITLQEQAGGLVLEVHDNGRGITDAELADAQSLGLVGMRERALLLGGNITFAGNTGSGTTVRVRIPLEQPSQG
ncbi:MAG: Putative Hybrid sensor histidine kinase [Nitrospira sp.]|nr:MAG: Putative Hybrid sensor histidine kinase [Nitrospira sp.]